MKTYTKAEILANPNIVIHCENAEQWEILKEDFHIDGYDTFIRFKEVFEALGGELNCFRPEPSGITFRCANVSYYKEDAKYTIITFSQYDRGEKQIDKTIWGTVEKTIPASKVQELVEEFERLVATRHGLPILLARLRDLIK